MKTPNMPRMVTRSQSSKRPAKHSFKKKLLVTLIAGSIFLPLGAYATPAQKPLFITGEGLPPNILLIPDNSESNQEGLDGRVALDWNNPSCVPGPNFNASICPAGARYENSKASIVKRVGNQIIDNYKGQINLGLMAYQQYPAGTNFNDALDTSSNPRTVLWRLYHRPLDIRYSSTSNPSFLNPDHNEPWDSPTKRFIDKHPNRNVYFAYNDAIPGYERSDFTEYCHSHSPNDNLPNAYGFRCYNDVSISSTGSLNWGTRTFDGSVFLVDSMRQRNIPNFGTYINYMPLFQNEWRSTRSPGKGYLHVAIGGFNEDGTIDEDHWDSIRTKLTPQRINWNQTGNPMTDPSWPLISAGLTPLEGTMQTAKDFFLQTPNTTSSNFRNAQGFTNNAPIPLSCDANAAIWVTDGLPSVASDGTSLGTNLVQAMLQARDSVADFHESTGVKTYIVGFALPNSAQTIFDGAPEFASYNSPLDVLAEAGGTGTSFSATNEEQLNEVMQQIFSTIISTNRASAGQPAQDGTSIIANASLFTPSFDPNTWTGDIRAFRVLREPAGEGENTSRLSEEWSASSRMPSPNNRNIKTWVPDDNSGSPSVNEGSTLPFPANNSDFSNDLAQLTLSQQSGLSKYSNTLDVVSWLRGDRSVEGNGLRTRGDSVIGDIVGSSPLFIQSQDFGYSRFTDISVSYSSFVSNNRTSNPLLMVAANDGKLHAFDARIPCDPSITETQPSYTCSSSGGQELFAIKPYAVYKHLADIAQESYVDDRQYIFDGTPVLGHVFDSTENKWRRIVVTPFGAGVKGLIAIDVDSQEVLWEINEYNNSNVGKVIGTPVMGRAATGEWITVVPSGYQTGQGGSLQVIDTLTGDVLRSLKPNNSLNSADNALFSPLPLDLTGNRRIDRLYAGDLKGNLWRFDLKGNGPNQWDIPFGSGNTDDPLFSAGPDRPITSRPTAARSPDGQIFIYFGTGKFFEVGDNSVDDEQLQAMYGIQDRDDRQVLPSELHRQSIEAEVEAFGYNLRVTTNTRPQAADRGWFLELSYPTLTNSRGERIVSSPMIRSGNRLVFTTLQPLPNEDPCEPNTGTGWLMEINAFTGARLLRSPWDLSGLGFGDESFVDVDDTRAPASGIQSPVGIPSMPVVMTDPEDPTREYKFIQGSDDEIWEVPDELRVDAGRLFWRQLR